MSDYTCEQCGKTFSRYNPGEYLYKKNGKTKRTLWFCCYTCKNKYEDEHPVKKHRRVK